jgi:hypothetical protein
MIPTITRLVSGYTWCTCLILPTHLDHLEASNRQAALQYCLSTDVTRGKGFNREASKRGDSGGGLLGSVMRVSPKRDVTVSDLGHITPRGLNINSHGKHTHPRIRCGAARRLRS